ncbi:hypothetical protein [Nocardia xishanensis]
MSLIESPTHIPGDFLLRRSDLLGSHRGHVLVGRPLEPRKKIGHSLLLRGMRNRHRVQIGIGQPIELDNGVGAPQALVHSGHRFFHADHRVINTTPQAASHR